MSLELNLASEVWEVVKPSIISSDRSSVADNLVSMLIDNGYAAEDIRSAFRNDWDIIEALKYYVSDDDNEEWTDDEEDILDDDDDEW